MPLPDYEIMSTNAKNLSVSSEKKENGTLVIFTCNPYPWVVNWQDRYNPIKEIADKNKIGVVFVKPKEVEPIP